jgi:hypothetical protein
MLYIGYKDENNRINRMKAMIIGFIPFFIMFGIIFIKYVNPVFISFNYFLFFAYLLLWSLYGFVYIIDEKYRNISMNALDLTSKGIIAVIICYFYG